MKVYNITDGDNPTLVFRGLVRVPVKVGNVVIKPGCFVELPDKAATRAEMQLYVASGALSVDGVPAGYVPKPDEEAEVE